MLCYSLNSRIASCYVWCGMTETSIGYLNDWSFLTLHWRKLQKVDVDGSLCGIDSCSKQEHIKGLLFIFTQGSSFSCYSFCIKVIFYCSKFYLVVSCESQSSCRAACGQWTGIYRALSSLTDHLKCFRVQERFIHIESFFSVHLKHFIHLSPMARFESPTFQA